MIFEDRITIERELNNHESFKAIGLLMDKDCTTISKAVRSHQVFKKSGVYGRPFNNYMNCTHCQLYGICDTCSFGSEKHDHRCSSCGRCTDTCPSFKEGRTRADYEAYICKNPDTPIVQLDSVEGIKNGAVLLTVTFVSTGLQLAFRRGHNDARSVSDIFDRLYLELLPDIFIALLPICLPDNGSELSDPKRIEFDANGNR